jgi:hypothetical protein
MLCELNAMNSETISDSNRTDDVLSVEELKEHT